MTLVQRITIGVRCGRTLQGPGTSAQEPRHGRVILAIPLDLLRHEPAKILRHTRLRFCRQNPSLAPDLVWKGDRDILHDTKIVSHKLRVNYAQYALHSSRFAPGGRAACRAVAVCEGGAPRAFCPVPRRHTGMAGMNSSYARTPNAHGGRGRPPSNTATPLPTAADRIRILRPPSPLGPASRWIAMSPSR